MIALGMPVQIRRCGTTLPVEALGIGDLLYEPLRDNYIEIVDILSRDTALLDHNLARIPAGGLGRNKPSRDIILSRQQPVVQLARSSHLAKPQLGFGPACSMGEELRLATRLFAIFAEQAGCICVAGALLQLPERLTTAPEALPDERGRRQTWAS